MPVTKRGRGYLAAVHHRGERYRRQFDTEAEALAWELQAKAALLKGEAPDMGGGSTLNGAPLTLSGLRDLTIKLKWSDNKAASTAILNANLCIKALGDVSPSKVSTQAIDAMVFGWIDEGKSNGTINRRLSALSLMLKIAAERGYIAAMPKISRRKEPEGRIRFLTETEEKEVLKWFEFKGDIDMEQLVILAVDTGMRQGELLRLAGRDINGGKINVWLTKSGKPRTVPMTPRVEQIVLARVKAMGDGPLFPNLTKDKVRQAWDGVRHHMKMTNDPHFVFHMLRHTFVSRLVQRGINLKLVAALAGHTTIITTTRYAHLAPEDLVEAMKVLE